MFRFTIRDVLWLTVVVRLALGWWTQFEDEEKCRSRLYDVERCRLPLLSPRPSATMTAALLPE
jgi:hypothetical protein